MLERDIEAKARAKALDRGWLVYKFTSPAHRSVPDRLFIKAGRVVFIEFKSATGELTPGQKREIERLQQHGVECYVCRTAKAAIEHLDRGGPPSVSA